MPNILLQRWQAFVSEFGAKQEENEATTGTEGEQEATTLEHIMETLDVIKNLVDENARLLRGTTGSDVTDMINLVRVMENMLRTQVRETVRRTESVVNDIDKAVGNLDGVVRETRMAMKELKLPNYGQ